MRKIHKGTEPSSLVAWKRSHPSTSYQDLTHVERQAIRTACTAEQFYLCAYCCQPISGESSDTVNEHLEARDIAPNKSLDFGNIVASCNSPNQCDGAHKAQPLPLTPLMDECETELQFLISGRVKGLTDRASESIQVLNLGDTEASNEKLVYARKRLVDALLLKNGINPEEGLEDDDLLQDIIDDLGAPNNGKLEAYAPVVVNILRGWLS